MYIYFDKINKICIKIHTIVTKRQKVIKWTQKFVANVKENNIKKNNIKNLRVTRCVHICMYYIRKDNQRNYRIRKDM